VRRDGDIRLTPAAVLKAGDGACCGCCCWLDALAPVDEGCTMAAETPELAWTGVAGAPGSPVTSAAEADDPR